MFKLEKILAHACPKLFRHVMLWVVAAAPFWILADVAASAEVSIRKKGEVNEILFTGDVVPGDYERFRKATSKLQTANVIFSSYGGNLGDGLGIAALINEKGFNTVVRDGNTCVSACGFMWLSGKQRSIGGGAEVGFHTAFDPKHDDKKSADGNAYVAVVLERLGFNEMVVAYTTEAAPRQMRWLTPNDAKFLGIDVTWVSPGEAGALPSTETVLLPKPPLSLLEAPILLRNEVEEALLKQRFMFLMKENYPDTYKTIVDAVARNQSSGKSWTHALFDAYMSTKLPDQLDERLMAAMTSVHIKEFVELYAIEVIQTGSRKNKLFCKRITKNKTAFDEQLVDAISYGPESYRNGLVELYGKALETALSANAAALPKATKVTRKEKRLADREMRRLVINYVNKLSKTERKRLFKSKNIFDTEFGCPVLIYMFRELEKKPEVLRYLFSKS